MNKRQKRKLDKRLAEIEKERLEKARELTETLEDLTFDVYEIFTESYDYKKASLLPIEKITTKDYLELIESMEILLNTLKEKLSPTNERTNNQFLYSFKNEYFSQQRGFQGAMEILTEKLYEYSNNWSYYKYLAIDWLWQKIYDYLKEEKNIAA